MSTFTSASLVDSIVRVFHHVPLILHLDYRSSVPIAFHVAMFFISATVLALVRNRFRAKGGSVWIAVPS